MRHTCLYVIGLGSQLGSLLYMRLNRNGTAEVAHKNIIIKWVNSNDQIADAFNKILASEKLEYFRNLILK